MEREVLGKGMRVGRKGREEREGRGVWCVA